MVTNIPSIFYEIAAACELVALDPTKSIEMELNGYAAIIYYNVDEKCHVIKLYEVPVEQPQLITPGG